MKIKLVFDDWRKEGNSIYGTSEGVKLSMYDFHAGSTFRGKIVLDKHDEDVLKDALKQGYQPVFWVRDE